MKNRKKPPSGVFGLKTLYSRILFSFSLIVVLSMTILTLMLGAMFTRQFMQQRVDEMTRETAEVNSIMEEKYWPKEKRDAAFEEMDLIARKYNALIQVFDKTGEITITDPQKRSDWEERASAANDPGTAVSQQEFFDRIIKGDIIQTQGYFGDSFTEPVMTVGRPLIIQGQIEGAIFMHEKVTDISSSIQAMYSNVLLSAAIAIFAAVVFIAFFAGNFTRPLTDMNKAARSYAKGDFTERVSVESADEIGELAVSLNTMANDLAGMESMRSSFVANVSHELKAPLSSMRGFVQAVIDGSVPEKDSREYLGIVLEETVRLNSLINDLLDLSKIESGEFPMHRSMFDINELIRRTLITFEGRIDEKSIEIVADFPKEYLVVDADKDRIAQVVSNLIDNAIKYTDPGGKIFIATRPSDSKAIVSVRDTGIGIPEEDLPHIFDRFYKVEKAHTPGVEGTGLGLSIAKKIIEQHECVINCRSKAEKGTVFSFTLPLAMQ